MKIKKIIWQLRRDFTAVYVCEHCAVEETSDGYDDYNFHHNVIPKMICKTCEKSAGEDYVPRDTKYEAHQVV